jgi:hypothetical protein
VSAVELYPCDRREETKRLVGLTGTERFAFYILSHDKTSLRQSFIHGSRFSVSQTTDIRVTQTTIASTVSSVADLQAAALF